MPPKVARTFVPSDLVFAKVKGFPPWPARIETSLSVKKSPGRYPVLFFGTYQTATVGAKDLFPYEQFKAKYGSYKVKYFKESIEEIESMPHADVAELQARRQSGAIYVALRPGGSEGERVTHEDDSDASFYQTSDSEVASAVSPSSAELSDEEGTSKRRASKRSRTSQSKHLKKARKQQEDDKEEVIQPKKKNSKKKLSHSKKNGKNQSNGKKKLILSDEKKDEDIEQPEVEEMEEEEDEEAAEPKFEELEDEEGEEAQQPNIKEKKEKLNQEREKDSSDEEISNVAIKVYPQTISSESEEDKAVVAGKEEQPKTSPPPAIGEESIFSASFLSHDHEKEKTTEEVIEPGEDASIDEEEKAKLKQLLREKKLARKLADKVREKEHRKRVKKEKKRLERLKRAELKAAKKKAGADQPSTSKPTKESGVESVGDRLAVIYNQIKLSLSIQHTNTDKCIQALDSIDNVKFTSEPIGNYIEQLKELVATIKKCRRYKDSNVRSKADHYYYKVKQYVNLGSNPNIQEEKAHSSSSSASHKKTQVAHDESGHQSNQDESYKPVEEEYLPSPLNVDEASTED